MSIEAEHQSEEQQVAGEIFDRYAEATRAGEMAKDLGNRAIAAAEIIAYTAGRKDWFEILDSALQTRGVNSHYSELTPDKLRARSRIASDQTTNLTKRCRTVIQELRALNTFDTKTKSQ